MKNEEEINKRIRYLFSHSAKGTYAYENDEQMKEIAILHWVLDDNAIYKQIETKKKLFR